MLLSFFSCEKEKALNSDNYLYPEQEKWFSYLCSSELGGRYSGSDGIMRAKSYIGNIIGRSDSLCFDTFQTSICEMTNIIFHIEGETDSLIVIGAHYDAYGFNNKDPLPGADDNLSGVAVLLNTIKKIQSNLINPHYSFDICFFDGEEIGRYGSKHYVDKCRRGLLYYINIDTCGNPSLGLSLAYSSYSPELASITVNLQKTLNMSLVEYNPSGFTTDCEPFEVKKIPFFTIGNESFSSYQHTWGDDVSHISFLRIDRISNSLFDFLRTK